MMRLLLLPLVLLALFAPSKTCETRTYVQIDGKLEIPPLYFGNPVVPLGTDNVGRDLGCLMTRGLQHTFRLAALILLLGFVPGLLVGVWIGSSGRTVRFQGEVFLLAGLLLLLGIGAYVLVLAIGVALYVARVSSGVVAALSREAFLEGALAVGGSRWHIIKTHYQPHLRVRLSSLLAGAFAAMLLWMAELAVLGFYSQGVFSVNLIGGDSPREFFAFPADPDLAQWIAFVRFSWIAQPELLLFPALLLLLLILGLMDFPRASRKPQNMGGSSQV